MDRRRSMIIGLVVLAVGSLAQYRRSCGEGKEGDLMCICTYIAEGRIIAECNAKHLTYVPKFTIMESIFLTVVIMNQTAFCHNGVPRPSIVHCNEYASGK